jgi:hypothetical protein
VRASGARAGCGRPHYSSARMPRLNFRPLSGAQTIGDGCTAKARRLSNERIEPGLSNVCQVDRIEEYRNAAEVDFAERIEFEVRFA